MLYPLRFLVVFLVRIFRSRRALLLENLALRQQLVVRKQRYPRPQVSTSDKLFWVTLRRPWPEWMHALILVQPETVVCWHRAEFKLYWTWLSQRRVRAGGKCVSKQLREAFPYDSAPGYLIYDRGPQFNGEVTETVKSFGIGPKRTSFRSPWQNGIAERWVATCRRDLLTHVIVLNQRHLKRLMNEYARNYLDGRTNLALEKGTPAGCEARETPGAGHEVTSMPGLGGLHRRYNRAA
jgi:transposase InsO family protein